MTQDRDALRDQIMQLVKLDKIYPIADLMIHRERSIRAEYEAKIATLNRHWVEDDRDITELESKIIEARKVLENPEPCQLAIDKALEILR